MTEKPTMKILSVLFSLFLALQIVSPCFYHADAARTTLSVIAADPSKNIGLDILKNNTTKNQSFSLQSKEITPLVRTIPLEIQPSGDLNTTTGEKSEGIASSGLKKSIVDPIQTLAPKKLQLVNPEPTGEETNLEVTGVSGQNNQLQPLSSSNTVKGLIEPDIKAPGSTGGITTAKSPAIVSNVTYAFTREVVQSDLSTITMNQNGWYELPGSKVKPGDVLIDENLQQSLKVMDINERGEILGRQPGFAEIFSKFEIPEQKIVLNEANFHVNPDLHTEARWMDEGSMVQTKAFTNVDDLEAFKDTIRKDAIAGAMVGRGLYIPIPEGEYSATSPDGKSVKVKVSGEIAYGTTLDIKYTAFDGYRFALEGGELVDLNVDFIAASHEETELALGTFGVDIPKVGRIGIELYLLIRVDGNIQVKAYFQEGLWARAGVQGGTTAYIPTSIKPLLQYGYFVDGNFDTTAEVTAHAYLVPSVGVTAFGCKLASLESRFGATATAKANLQEAMLKFNMYVAFYVTASFLGESIDIVNERWPLFEERQKVYREGFSFETSELDAYTNQIGGLIKREKVLGDEADQGLYTGDVNIEYTHEGEVRTITITVTDGEFIHDFGDENINIVKGDSVRIMIPGKQFAVTEPIFSSIPFKTISVGADFFQDRVRGKVDMASSIVIFPDDKGLYHGDTNHMLAYDGPVEIALSHNNLKPTLTPVQTNPQDGTFQVDMDISPSTTVKASAIIDGFELTADGGKARANIMFTKSKRDTEEIVWVPSTDGGQDVAAVIHHLSHDFVATNTAGDKQIDKDVHITVTVGETSNKGFNEVAKQAAREVAGSCFKSTMNNDPMNLYYYEYNSLKKMPKERYTRSGDSPLKAEWLGSQDQNTGVGTHMYWAWQERSPDLTGMVLQPGIISSLADNANVLPELHIPETDKPGGEKTGLKAAGDITEPAYKSYELQSTTDSFIGPQVSDERSMETKSEYTAYVKHPGRFSGNSDLNTAYVDVPTDWNDPILQMQTDCTFEHEGVVFHAKELGAPLDTSSSCHGGPPITTISGQYMNEIDQFINDREEWMKHNRVGVDYWWNPNAISTGTIKKSGLNTLGDS